MLLQLGGRLLLFGSRQPGYSRVLCQWDTICNLYGEKGHISPQLLIKGAQK